MESSMPRSPSQAKLQSTAASTLSTGAKKRLVALDVVRGLTMLLMIIFNSPGSWEHLYYPLSHAEWNGFTLADFGFPFFIFVVGISIALSYNKRMEAQASTRQLVSHTAKRAAVLFALGILLNLISYNFTAVRIPGVLQRIAIVYFVCAFLFMTTTWKTQLRIGAGILVVYWLLLLLVPVPGIGRGVIEPGANLAAWLDSRLIPGTLYYGSWDPEGFLSTFPAIVTGIFGILTGHLILSQQPLEKKVIDFYSYGFTLFIIGGIWNWFFPYNKSLWSSSYVVYTAGISMLVMGFFIWMIDLRGYSRWFAPTLIFGANAIGAYILHIVLKLPLEYYYFEWNGAYYSAITLFTTQVTQAGFSPQFASLAWAITFMLICGAPLWFLYRRRLFLKV